MNTATISIRLTAAASAALLAMAFAGCANADTAHAPVTRGSDRDAGQVAVRFVPSDDDPRGRHIVCEPVPDPAPALPPGARSVPSDDDPRGRHGLTAWEIARLQQHLG